MSTSYVIKTGLTASTNTSYTISMWVKFTKTTVSSGSPYMWSCGAQGSGAQGLYINNSDMKLAYYGHSGYTSHSGLSNGSLRDLSGWYHIVWSVNAGTGTCYINGVQQGSTRSGIAPLNAHGGTEMALNTYVGTSYSTYDDLGPYMSHVHFIDGTAYPATTFGETDSTTGEWKIKTAPSVTYGTNGFFLFKDNASVNDQSGNGNNFTATGTVTQTEDNPSNVFATWNPLVPSGGGFQSNSSTFRYGNNDFVTNNSSSNYGLCTSTLGMTTGKYYMEVHYESNSNQCLIGIMGNKPTSTANYIGGHAHSYGLYTNGNYYNATSGTSYGTSFTNGDYIGIFLDLDNNKLYFSKNGTVMNSGTGISITSASSTELGCYFFSAMEWNSSGNGDFAANFGNGSFRTTQLTGTTYDGADGNGIFKYEPTGLTLDSTTKSFKSLSTKGLNN